VAAALRVADSPTTQPITANSFDAAAPAMHETIAALPTSARAYRIPAKRLCPTRASAMRERSS
jgi:hypothetical protein